MKWPRLWLPPINLYNAPRMGTMGQDNGMDASPSWQELKDQRDMLRAALEHIVECWDGPLYQHEMLPLIAKARAALKEVDDER